MTTCTVYSIVYVQSWLIEIDRCCLISSEIILFNCVWQGGWTALMWAAYKGRTDVAQLLLEKGANPNITGQVLRLIFFTFPHSKKHVPLCGFVDNYTGSCVADNE